MAEMITALDIHRACATCVFYGARNNDNAPGGSCHRYPPSIITPDGGPWQPYVERGEWCGEHRAVGEDRSDRWKIGEPRNEEPSHA